MLLGYTDGTAKTATTDSTGTYTFTVPYYWSGTVTPSSPGYRFFPADRTYSNVQLNQIAQDYIADNIPPSVTTIARVNPNPTAAFSVDFSVTFSETVTGVDTTDFSLSTTGTINGAVVSGVSGAGTTYTVTVSTGSGTGMIRLDLIDDDTIVDVVANPLGGSGVGNGDFTSGESYSIDKTAPTVVSSLRSDPHLTYAASVNFIVTFSEPVTGVSATDFSLLTTGTISGAVVSGVSGAGTTYTVTVTTGSGAGTIRLDLIDDDTIVDVVANPLGGLGVGNGDFTSGEAYVVRLYYIYLPIVLRN
jgi:hypothetical protein